MTITAAQRLELQGPNDALYNYCLWQYPPARPTGGKLASSNLLYESFDLLNAGDSAYELVDRIRSGIGLFRSVWGLKRAGNLFAWEYYFYDYRRVGRERSMSRVLQAMAPLVCCDVTPNEDLHYFMFSLDIDHALLSGARAMDEIHMYIGNAGSQVSSGISYSVKRDCTRLENFYFFFRPAEQMQDIVTKIRCSAFMDQYWAAMDDILWPELVNCSTICLANKRGNDCIYFSGIDVDQLLVFLRRMAYPAAIIAYVESNHDRLDHLLYDVGLDYVIRGDHAEIVKSAYYGVF